MQRRDRRPRPPDGMQKAGALKQSVAGAVAAKLVRPSNGHIAVAEVVEAAAWGQACSCWPVGDLDYLYLGSSRLLYPPDPAPRPGPSSASGAEEEMFVQDLRVNTYLGTGTRIYVCALYVCARSVVPRERERESARARERDRERERAVVDVGADG